MRDVLSFRNVKCDYHYLYHEQKEVNIEVFVQQLNSFNNDRKSISFQILWGKASKSNSALKLMEIQHVVLSTNEKISKNSQKYDEH